ncbi:aminopeptidase N-like isoform X2 [Venturia canescens]|uniref:aminopeptidase N-like isoform X2 n=1 Tax=Venturia canescens TaxID=32260 RepID=UPI001C9C1B1B|nr:aminopeptidase N-like isoform X2 [Venturia canescens]
MMPSLGPFPDFDQIFKNRPMKRDASNMAQFGNSRSEFMTSDLGLNDIEYERKGGFFMSHKKTAFVISAFVVIIIAAGFVGAYIGSIPKEKVYDTLALIESDVGCDHVVSSKFSLSKSLSPSRYRVELSPIIEGNTVTKLRGHVTIEFQYNGSSSLPQLVLNAKNVNLTSATLVSGKTTNSEDFKSRRKRSATSNDTEIVGNSTSSKADDSRAQNLTANVAADASSLGQKNASNETTTHAAQVQNSSTEMKAFEVSANTTEATVTPLTESSTTESSVKNETRKIAINRNETDEKAGFLVLYPEKAIKSGEYHLILNYEVPITNYVVYARNNSENSIEKWVGASRMQPTSLLDVFPAFNDVKMKARFQFNLPRPFTMKIYTNMPLKNSSKLSNDWVSDTFEETPPMSPENVVAVAGGQVQSLGKKTIGNVTMDFWGEKLQPGGAQYLVNKIESVYTNLATLFGVNISIPKLDIISERLSDYDSSYPGLIMVQEALYAVKNNSSKVTKELALMSLINLLGKQWLGGVVNSQNSSDNWILESSLLYLQHRLAKDIDAEFNHSTLVMDVQPDAFEVAGYSVARSLTSKLEPTHSNSYYTSEAYAIGACLINMLHGALSSMEFRAGYLSFVSRWSGGNADVISFWKAMTVNSTADEKPEGDVNLPEIMNLWSTAGGYPLVTVTRNYETGSAIVHQARFSYDKLSSASQQLWHIPLTWISDKNSNATLKWIKNQAETTLELQSVAANETNNETWFVFNPSKSGYYRVNYDQENWKLIAAALRENHSKFSPVTRASLVDDLFSAAFVRSIPYSVVFDVIQYLPENEQEPEPWAYLLQHAIKLNLVLYDSPEYSEYQERMLTFVSPLFNRVGQKIEEGSRLTMISHQLACMFSCPAYLTWAKRHYAGFERLPELPIKKNVPSYLRSSLLCAFAKLNGELSWQWWEQKFSNVTTRNERNSLLSSLACFQVPSLLQAVLNEIVYSNSFDEKDALVILDSFSIYPAATQAALKFVQSNWKNITRRYPKSCKVVTAFLDASSTGFAGEKDIEDFQSFKAKNYESLKKVGYVTALLEAKANASVSFITSLPNNPISEGNTTTLRDAEIQDSQTPKDLPA